MIDVFLDSCLLALRTLGFVFNCPMAVGLLSSSVSRA